MTYARFLLVFNIGTIISAISIAQTPATRRPDTVVINSFIKTYGFDYKDIDTILVKTYTKNSGFKNANDSFYVFSKDMLADSIQKIRYIDIGNIKRIYNTEDWAVILKGHLVYKISDIKTGIVIERQQFKRCKMVSFSLNGVTHKAFEIELVKPGFKKIKVTKQKKVNSPNDKHRLIL